jgi:hypothetical protein
LYGFGSRTKGVKCIMFNLGNHVSRGSATPSPDMPPLTQCLPLDPIILGSQKYTRSGELRRVLGVPSGSTSEDHSFGVSHPKPPPPVATEELKHFKESVQDASRKARYILFILLQVPITCYAFNNMSVFH